LAKLTKRRLIPFLRTFLTHGASNNIKQEKIESLMSYHPQILSPPEGEGKTGVYRWALIFIL
jgi:hypothetical protein